MIVKTIRAIRSSLEQPSTPLTSANIDRILVNGQPASSGVQVNRDSAIGVPAIKAGVEMVAGDVAKLPVKVYRTDSQGYKQELDAHPATRLLRRKMNPFITSHTLLKTLVGHALLHRGGYARIFRSAGGRPEALDLLDPERTHPVLIEGELVYQTTIEGRNRLLPQSDVFHIKGLGADGLDGWSLIDKLKEMIGLSIASQRYASVYFSNNAKPSVVITFPGYLKDQESIDRFRQSWSDVHGGVQNSTKPAVLEGGATIQPFQLSNEDSQFIQSRQFDVKMIAAALKIPPHKLGDDSKSSFASLEQENQRYLDEGIDPWLREIETQANDKLLTFEEWETGTFVEFVRQAFVRTDTKTEAEVLTTYSNNGIMTRGEVRRKLNLPPLDDPTLEELLVPLNMGGAEQESEENEEPPADEDDSDARTALLRTLEHQAEAFLKRLSKDAQRAAHTPEKFPRWLDSLEDAHGGVFVDRFAVVCGEGPAKTVLASVLGKVRSELLPAGDAENVRQVTTALQADFSKVIAERVVELWSAGRK